MTPEGLWSLGGGGSLSIRFTEDLLLLWILGTASIGIIAASNRIDPELAACVLWRRKDREPATSLIVGTVAGLAIATPGLLMKMVSANTLVSQDGPSLARLGTVLYFSLAGNLYEEVLFQGMLLKFFQYTPLQAARASAVWFAFLHCFLACSVSNAGPLLLLFCLYEGTVCAMVRVELDLLACTLAHGLGIFFLS
eukprot:CAMPEP_0114547180 /NCGR_PEP_ID=MMETSP0114-20121206/4330_1 /TAXON_ID=31324 /ORGANISM="Goniomonas sp, Strain m" /LENGTH=194 /DNA_ID=CAMNT_0001731725 /DNA_START=111 /DNA_END=692 /DNA_ORIENTATION=+